MGSFERAILHSRPINTPVQNLPSATQNPHGASSSHPITHPKVNAIDFSPTYNDFYAVEKNEQELEHHHIAPLQQLRWRLYLGQHRRKVYMLATVVFVVLASATIAGGVIWKLTNCE
jgi:hypothetical protein